MSTISLLYLTNSYRHCHVSPSNHTKGQTSEYFYIEENSLESLSIYGVFFIWNAVKTVIIFLRGIWPYSAFIQLRVNKKKKKKKKKKERKTTEIVQ